MVELAIALQLKRTANVKNQITVSFGAFKTGTERSAGWLTSGVHLCSEGLDWLVSEAPKYGVKLMLTLTNYQVYILSYIQTFYCKYMCTCCAYIVVINHVLDIDFAIFVR